MRNIIIGTAGHVDHGKTTLIKALTGIDTDRLKEEKERGMTIDLGFASLTLPNGQTVGVVDVPGHERFIKNMLAGAGGVDVALLVIAADESVMPQTVEHLEILELLEIKRGIVALTKADMVEADWLDAVVDDVRGSLSKTFLRESPIIPVSAPTGQGLNELLSALQSACDDVETRDSIGAFRLPIDRVFTLTGFGTVVTGTLVSGTVQVGDAVEILPSKLISRVRQIQVHGKKSEAAHAGSRVALNLAGLEVTDLQRGDTCATPELMKVSSTFDLTLTLLPNAPKPLRSRSRIRLYMGTAELLGRITILDKEELKPGESAFAQFRTETPSAALRGDRFVVRSYSPMLTIGGGMIVDPNARRHRRFDQAVIASLEARKRGTPEDLVEQVLKNSPIGMTRVELLKSAVVENPDFIVDSLKSQDKVVELEGGRLLHSALAQNYAENINSTLAHFLDNNPLRPGLPKEELRAVAASSMDSRIFATLLNYLESRGIVATSDTLVSLAGRAPGLTPQQKSTADSIVTTLSKASFNPPSIEELIAGSPLTQSVIKQILDLLVYQKQIVKVAEGLYFHHSAIVQAETLLRGYLEQNGKITVSQFRDVTTSSRKYALPLLEYFDSRKVTKRLGDERVLMKSAIIRA